MKKPKRSLFFGYMTPIHWFLTYLIAVAVILGCMAVGIHSLWLLFPISIVYWFAAHGFYNRRFDE